MSAYMDNTGTFTPLLRGYDSQFAFDKVDVDFAGSGTYVAAVGVYKYPIIRLTGLMTANRDFVVPSTGFWEFRNDCTGSYAVTVKVSGQTGVVVPQGSRVLVYADGVDVRFITPPVGSTGGVLSAIVGRAAIAMSDADYTVNPEDYVKRILAFTGTLTAGRNVVLPTVAGAEYAIYNNTTGGFSLTGKTSGGTGIAIAATKHAVIYCDGTNYVRMTADA